MEPFSLFEDSIQCCYLCHEGQKVFQLLVDHFRKFHQHAFNQLPDASIVQICACPDALQLQFQLVHHILSKSLIQSGSSQSEMKIEKPDDEDPQKSSNESIVDEIQPSKRKRRRRDELEVEEGFTVQCDFCPRLFTKTQSLQNHYDLMHDPGNPHKCNLCSHGHCKTLRNLNAHLKSHDDDKNADKTCPKCNKKWQTHLQLYHHLLTHREKRFQCDVCGMKFNMKNTLCRHIVRTHFQQEKKSRGKGSEKRTLCQHCSMWISFYNLKRHIRTSHSSNKHIYKCDFEGCLKSFTEAQTLKDHKNLHLGLKPYICEFCTKSFPHIATLRRHKYRHTDPEKYKCDICSECFVTRKSLTNHVERQHHNLGNDSKPFACDYDCCTATFKYENYLQNHKRDVHIKKRNRVKSGKSEIEYL